ncbi:hypothetical protein M2323_004520 [Rhodoblastus acidophilus]|nr:hypothetical protein [Rhodoblastus acidophilus]MCW2335570.1 hypothetical protein [Rhodoblastus acidophilus]
MVDHTKTLIHDAKQLLVQLYDDYDCLGNWTHVDNVVHHRWLKWLGFKFINKVELTPGNHFYEFARLKGTT